MRSEREQEADHMGFVDHYRDCGFYSELERHERVLNREVIWSNSMLEGSSDCGVETKPSRDKNGSRETTGCLHDSRQAVVAAVRGQQQRRCWEVISFCVCGCILKINLFQR